MSEEPLLLALAEVSIALTGFSGVVIFLGRRASGQWSETDQTRFWSLIECGLMALLMSLLPFAVRQLEPSPNMLWGASSGIVAVPAAISFIAWLRRARRAMLVSDPEANPLLGLVAITGWTAVIVALALNALGIGLERSFGPYLMAIFWYLFLACLLFLRLLRFR
jgi:hypothetical protein